MRILHSTINGKGFPLLILHGYFGMSDNWRSLGKRFSEHFQVHLIDQRNHGRSFHDSEFNYTVMAEDLKNYAAHNRLDEFYLLGHSMGGKTAMQFACSHPNLVKKMVVVDIAPNYYKPHHGTILQALNSVDFEKHSTRGDIEKQLKSFDLDFGIIQFLLKNVYWKNKEQLAYRFNLNSLTDNNSSVGEVLPDTFHFNKPTLFIKGEKSDYITAPQKTKIHNHFNNASIKSIANAGHWVHAENPTLFYDQVISFLNGTDI